MSRLFRISFPAAALVLSLCTSAALVRAAVSDSSPTPAPQASPSGHRLQWLQQKLDLSADQVQQIQAVYAANSDVKKELRGQLKAAFTAFRQAALNGSADDSNVKALSGQMLDLKAKELQEIGAILTADQRTAFAQLKGHHRWHRWHRGFGDSTTPVAPAASTPAAG